MAYCGNHLIDGDNGEDPFSPYYTGKDEDVQTDDEEEEEEYEEPFDFYKAIRFWDNFNAELYGNILIKKGVLNE